MTRDFKRYKFYDKKLFRILGKHYFKFHKELGSRYPLQRGYIWWGHRVLYPNYVLVKNWGA